MYNLFLSVMSHIKHNLHRNTTKGSECKVERCSHDLYFVFILAIEI